MSEHPLDRAMANELASERPRDDQGRFVSPDAEPLTGRAAELAEHGYSEMPQAPERDAGDSFDATPDGLRAAAEEVATRRSETDEPLFTPRQYEDLGGVRHPSETVTAEKAARDLNIAREFDRQQARELADKAAAEALGLNQTAQGEPAQPSTSTAPESPSPAAAEPAQADGVDPQLKAALENPQVREALQREFAAVEQAKAQYAASIQQAAQIGAAAALSEFPELAQVSAQDLPAALAKMGETDPHRAARAGAAIQRVQALANEHARVQQVRAAQAQQVAAAQWQHYTKSHDATFNMLATKDVPEWNDPAFRSKVTETLIEGAKELGVSQAELHAAYNSNPILRSAPMQKMMLDAARWRMAQQGVRNAARNPLPPVQRPGTRQERSAVPYAIEQAQKSFLTEPSLRNAAALRAAHYRNARSRSGGNGIV